MEGYQTDAKFKHPLRPYQRKEKPAIKDQIFIWHDLGEVGHIWDLQRFK